MRGRLRDKLFEQQKGERRVVPSRDVPCQPAGPGGQSWHVGDAPGSGVGDVSPGCF